ncbi:AraC family transcriptional regulator [Klebsiella pneumoniae]|uniref:AraC family transcriptional regulator n=1 Tax=Klebsiella pneumoniae TaxID=573 RepID=UPI0021E74064|nr:AraC family transcriptional regulator [Klebsiella pneumoniae]
MEHHAGDFSVTVRDVRQLTQPESDLLTLLWVLEGSVNLAVAEGASQPLAADGLAIVNRNRRWSLRSAGANAVMILTLSASWLARLDNAFFAVDYQITPRTRDADDGLRRLMRQLLVSGLVNHPGHYRLEANRWLSEIALLLATRFSQPIASTPRRDTEKWSRRIASVVARIDANYQRRLSLQEVAADRLYARLNEPEPRDRESPPLPINPPQTREINLRDRPARPVALRHTRMVVTVRELDDLLRADVRRELEQLHHALPVYAIDINDPFLSSRLFGTGWDDPQMAGYACWYNLQQIFSWLAAMGWQVILHTGVTTRSDLLQRFLQLAANHFPPATLNSWRFVWHWSPQASEAARQAAWRQQRGVLHRLLPQPQLGIWHRFAPSDPGNDPLFHSPLLAEADFLACQADANEQLDLAQADSRRLASSEHYPLHKLRQIHSALRQRQLNLPLWLLSWNTLTGDTRDTNGRFFRGALLMDNLLGVADQVWLAGFWLNSGLQGEARANGKLDTSSLALHYLHGLPRPVYWVLWLWRRLRGEILVHDKNLLLLHHQGHYQLLLRNTVVYNPWLSSEAAFIQRFSQPYSVRLQGLDGSWRIKQHLFDQHHGALFPLVDAFRSRSGPDAEDYQWLMHQARPALSVDEARLDGYWLRIDSLQSNALVLYEFTPQLSSGADPAP